MLLLSFQIDSFHRLHLMTVTASLFILYCFYFRGLLKLLGGNTTSILVVLLPALPKAEKWALGQTKAAMLQIVVLVLWRKMGVVAMKKMQTRHW
jgi:hypothetical protein